MLAARRGRQTGRTRFCAHRVMRRFGCTRRTSCRRAAPVARRDELTVRCEEFIDVLERQLRRILTAPTCQRRADRLCRFVAGNIMAAETAVPTNRSATHIVELPLG